METTGTLKNAAKTLVQELRKEVEKRKTEVAILEERIEKTATLCNGVDFNAIETTEKQEESSPPDSNAARVEVGQRYHDTHKTSRSDQYHGMARNSKSDRHDWPGVIRGFPGHITIKDIMQKTGVEKGYAASRIHALSKQGYLERVDRGIYRKTNKATNAGRN